jgi:hypothetical protein
MTIELNVPELIVAAAHVLIVASLFCFCYLVARFGAQTLLLLPDAGRSFRPEHGQDAMIVMLQGEFECNDLRQDARAPRFGGVRAAPATHY